MGENQLNNCNMIATKRKVSVRETEVDVHTKHDPTSPNPAKKRREEMIKILKLSMEKWTEISDPEFYLIGNNLINNTAKLIQENVTERSYSNNTEQCSIGYSIPNDKCNQGECILKDDFIYEKITDDMTDTLIHYVFHDEPTDTSTVSSECV